MQDFLTSAFLVTSKDCFYSRSEFGLLCTYMGDAAESYDLPVPTILKPVELWTGKQIFSAMVRPNAATRCSLLLGAVCSAALCCPALHCAALPCPALPCPALPCPALRCAVLCCAVLCCAVLWISGRIVYIQWISD